MNLLANILAARGEDGNPELWFYLVLAIVFIGKSVISYLKTKREDNEEEPDLETEDHHEKRVREVIAEMRRTVPERPQQAPRQEVPQPRVAARAPRPAPSPVELPNPSVKRKQRPQPDPVPDWGHGHAQEAARNTMERYVKAEEGAHESIRSLSDAGRSSAFAATGKGTAARIDPFFLPSWSPPPERFPSAFPVSENGHSLSGNPRETESPARFPAVAGARVFSGIHPIPVIRPWLKGGLSSSIRSCTRKVEKVVFMPQ